MFDNLFKYKEKTSTKEEALKDELWNDYDVIWFLAKHHTLSLNKSDYSLNDLKRIKMASETDKKDRLDQHKANLNRILAQYK